MTSNGDTAMMWWSRMPFTAGERGPELPRGEHVLAEATGVDGSRLLGTERALYIADPTGAHGSVRRVPWEQVERADWNAETSTLAVVEVAEFGDVESRTEVELAERGRLLELLRERVTKSVLIQIHAPVYGKRGVTVVGRRPPSGGGAIQWSYVYALGLDPTDPTVIEVSERTLAEAQAELDGL